MHGQFKVFMRKWGFKTIISRVVVSCLQYLEWQTWSQNPNLHRKAYMFRIWVKNMVPKTWFLEGWYHVFNPLSKKHGAKTQFLFLILWPQNMVPKPWFPEGYYHPFELLSIKHGVETPISRGVLSCFQSFEPKTWYQNPSF